MSTEQGTPGSTRLGGVNSYVRSHRGLFLRLLAVVLLLALWELYASTQPDYFFPGLAVIYEAFVEQLREYGLVTAFLGTMTTVFVGYSIALVVGIVVGLGMGLDRRIEVTLDPYVSAMYVAPVSALVPIIIIVGGASFWSRVLVVFLFVVFEIVINTMNGSKTVPDGLIDAGRSFGAGRLTIVRQIVLPHTLPHIFAGMRLGIGRAIKGVILAELLIEFTNLGAVIREWEQIFQISGVISVTVLLMFTGLILTRAVGVLRTRVITWENGGDR